MPWDGLSYQLRSSAKPFLACTKKTAPLLSPDFNSQLLDASQVFLQLSGCISLLLSPGPAPKHTFRVKLQAFYWYYSKRWTLLVLG